MIFLVSSFTSYLMAYKYLALFIIVFSGSFIVPVPLNEIILVAGDFCQPWLYEYPADHINFSFYEYFGGYLRLFPHLQIRRCYFQTASHQERYGVFQSQEISGKLRLWNDIFLQNRRAFRSDGEFRIRTYPHPILEIPSV